MRHFPGHERRQSSNQTCRAAERVSDRGFGVLGVNDRLRVRVRVWAARCAQRVPTITAAPGAYSTRIGTRTSN